MSKNETKLKNLHEKFNLAENAIDQMTVVVDSLEEDLTSLEVTEIGQPGEYLPENNSQKEVFTLDLLKSDFMTMRSNIMSVINRGQKILEETGTLEIGDMKASQLEALAQLQKSTGDNIKLLMGIYRDIIAVEKDKYILMNGLNQEMLGAGQGQIQVAAGATLNQNVIVAGSTHDILRLMEKAKEETNGSND